MAIELEFLIVGQQNLLIGKSIIGPSLILHSLVELLGLLDSSFLAQLCQVDPVCLGSTLFLKVVGV